MCHQTGKCNSKTSNTNIDQNLILLFLLELLWKSIDCKMHFNTALNFKFNTKTCHRRSKEIIKYQQSKHGWKIKKNSETVFPIFPKFIFWLDVIWSFIFRGILSTKFKWPATWRFFTHFTCNEIYRLIKAAGKHWCRFKVVTNSQG